MPVPHFVAQAFLPVWIFERISPHLLKPWKPCLHHPLSANHFDNIPVSEILFEEANEQGR
jgi:hypothetical protein